MASVTYSEFGVDTEGIEVAKAFGDKVRGKTVLITGGNRNGLGFSAAQAIVSLIPLSLTNLVLTLFRYHRNHHV